MELVSRTLTSVMQKTTLRNNQPTKRQLDYLVAIHELSSNGRPPSWAEIAEKLGKAPNAAKGAVVRLQKAGFVDFTPVKHRSLAITALGYKNLASIKQSPVKVTAPVERRQLA